MKYVYVATFEEDCSPGAVLGVFDNSEAAIALCRRESDDHPWHDWIKKQEIAPRRPEILFCLDGDRFHWYVERWEVQS